jgi:DNA-binding HxlR family transcriptional regulator
LIILYHKPVRFNKLKQLVNGVSGNMLTVSLRQLEKDKLISKTDGNHYCLTETSQKIVDLLIQIKILIESL